MHGSMRAIALSGLFLVSSTPAYANSLPETPQFRTFAVAEGLPSVNIGALVLDNEGYLWVGSRNGLARFDGARFQHFEHNPADPTSAPEGAILSLHVDKEGRVWVGTDGYGAARFDAATGTFLHAGGTGSPMEHADPVAIQTTRDGSVWFGTLNDGLFRLDA